MPGKARRVASRQSQLSQRRKRQQRGPRGIPAVDTIQEPEGEESAHDAVAQPTPSTAPVDSPAARPNASPTPASSVPRPLNPARARREQTSSANYVGAEVRRILLMGSVILTVIVVLGFVTT